MAVDEARNDLLIILLAEFKIMKALLASMSDEKITARDVD